MNRCDELSTRKTTAPNSTGSTVHVRVLIRRRHANWPLKIVWCDRRVSWASTTYWRSYWYCIYCKNYLQESHTLVYEYFCNYSTVRILVTLYCTYTKYYSTSSRVAHDDESRSPSLLLLDPGMFIVYRSLRKPVTCRNSRFVVTFSSRRSSSEKATVAALPKLFPFEADEQCHWIALCFL